MIFEDLSDLLKAQKQAAWREVARRIAHEIKNPLTPIALSAERIRRHLERGTPPDHSFAGCDPPLRRNHRRVGGDGAHAGGRVLDPRPLPASQPQPGEHQSHRGERAEHVRRPARWHPACSRSRARPAAGAGRSRCHQARPGKPGGQCRRSHGRLAGARDPRSHRAL